ncbi:MAG: hypothetical protein Q9226_009264 [Calogaya cf. arnoldii]
MSSSQGLNFSPEGNDTNDDQELAKHLEKFKLRFPATYGGFMQDDSNPEVTFNSFNTHTPPDITPNTRIVAVLGITQKEAVMPASMWFISDFFAFWNLFKGLTTIQHWLHCVDLTPLVDQNTQYLHGNPYKPRKVVLDHKILKGAQSAESGNTPIRQCKETLLLSTFRDTIKAECTAAAAAAENVLVMMFGHGDEPTYGIYLGGRGKAHLFRPSTLKRQMGNLNVNLAMLTTQCFGGGWACTPKLNLTTMTAGGKKKPSKAWRYSGSWGRACGSMFATAIINTLTNHPVTEQPLGTLMNDEDELEWTGDQHDSYAQFSKAVYESLLRDVDKRGLEHEITFSAQDDAWSMCWGQRSGISPGGFRVPLERTQRPSRGRNSAPWRSIQS